MGRRNIETSKRLELVAELAMAGVRDLMQRLTGGKRAGLVESAREEKEEMLFVQLTYRR
jgi:hypothetical protein